MALTQAPEPNMNNPADVMRVLSDPKATDNQVFNAIQRSAALAQNPTLAARVISDLQSRAADTHLQLGTRTAALLALSQINRPMAEQVLDKFKDVSEFKLFFDGLNKQREAVSNSMLADVRSGLKEGKLNDGILKTLSFFTVDATLIPTLKYVIHNGKQVESGFSPQFQYYVNYQQAAKDAYEKLNQSERTQLFDLMAHAEGPQIPQVLTVLANLARTHDNPEIRKLALQTIGRMANPYAIEPALALLAQFREYPQMALYQTDQNELAAARTAMLSSVRAYGRQMIEALNVLQDATSAPDKKAEALGVLMRPLGEYGTYGRWVILNLLPSDRMRIIDYLGKMDVPAYRGEALTALGDIAKDVRQKPEVRIAAVNALANINDEGALTLLNVLGKIQDLASTVQLARGKLMERLSGMAAQMMALVSNGDLGKLESLLSPHANPQGLLAFFTLAADKQRQVIEALKNIPTFNPNGAVAFLEVVALNSNYPRETRAAAVDVLGDIGAPAAYGALARMKDKFPELKASIDGALQRWESRLAQLTSGVVDELGKTISPSSKLLDTLSANNPLAITVWNRLTPAQQAQAITRLAETTSFKVDMRTAEGASLYGRLEGVAKFLLTIAEQRKGDNSLAAIKALGKIPYAGAVELLLPLATLSNPKKDQYLSSLMQAALISQAEAGEKRQAVVREVGRLAAISPHRLTYSQRTRLDTLLSGPYFNAAMDVIVEKPTRSGIERVIAVSHSIKGSEQYDLTVATALYQIVLARNQDLGKRAKIDENGYRTALAGLAGYALGGLAARSQMQSGLYNAGAAKPSNPALVAMALLYAQADPRVSDAAHTAMLYAYGHPLTFKKGDKVVSVTRTKGEQDAMTALIATIGDDEKALKLISAARRVAQGNHDKTAEQRLRTARDDISRALGNSK